MDSKTNQAREQERGGRGTLRQAALTGFLVGSVALLAGCDDILTIEDPENVTGESVTENLNLLINRAYSDFQVGYSGGGLDDKILSTTGVMTDEFMSAGTFSTRTRTDQRFQFATRQGNTSDGAYSDLHDARVSAINAAAAIQEQEGQNQTWAEMKALQGYAIVALAENFCGAVPLSTSQPTGARTTGQPMSTSELFNAAIAAFDAALGVASSGSDIQYLAEVGKARAQLGLGNIQEAGNTVSGVPRSFVYYIEHSSNSGTQQNPIFNLQLNGRYSLSNGEGDDTAVPQVAEPGGNGIAFHHLDGDPSNELGDPRVPWAEDPAGGFSAAIPLFLNLRVRSRNSNVVLADGIEAQLIRAEADIMAGSYGAAEEKLNDLRADVQTLMAERYGNPLNNVYGFTDTAEVHGEDNTLDDLDLPETQAGAVDVLFKERAFWLFNTGHRLADLRRLARAPYSRSPSEIFPTGSYFKGGQYGEDVSFPIPFSESNNPNYSIDMCSVTTP